MHFCDIQIFRFVKKIVILHETFIVDYVRTMLKGAKTLEINF